MLESINSKKIKAGYDHFCGSVSEICQAEDTYLTIYCLGLFMLVKTHHNVFLLTQSF